MSTGEYSEGDYTPSDSTLADPLSLTPSFPSQPPLIEQSSSRALLLEEPPLRAAPAPPQVSSQRIEINSAMNSQIRFESPPRTNNNNNDYNNSVFHMPPFPNSDSELTFGDETGDYILPRDGNTVESSSLLGYTSMSYDGNSGDSYKEEEEEALYYKSLILLSLAIVFIIGVVFVVALSGFGHLWALRSQPAFSIKSDWKDGTEIPAKYGCNAEKPISIPLSWGNVPEDATNLVLLISSPHSDEIYWIVSDIPLKGENKVESLVANASAANMPLGAHELPNSHSQNGHYYAPCHSNTFEIHAYAIDDHAKIAKENLKSSLKIRKSFVGVPTAKWTGNYAIAHGMIDEGHHGDTEESNDHGEHGENNSEGGHDSSENEHISDEEEHEKPHENEHPSEKEEHGESHENEHPSEEEHDVPRENEHHVEEKHNGSTEHDHSSEEGRAGHTPSFSHKTSGRTWIENLRKYL